MSTRTRAVLVMLVVGLFVLVLSIRGIANFFTDYLWFDAVGYSRVWRTTLVSQLVLAGLFVTVFAVLCWVNLWLAERLAPAYREPSPEEEAVARFREVVGERWGLVRLGVTAMFALSIGAGAASQWRNWLLFTNSVDFGANDAHFGRDIGFFVFRMPFLSWLANWLFTALFVVLVLTVAMHYLSGGIRIQSLDERVTPQVKAHISFLLAAMALVRAATYWIDRYSLAYSADGRFAGLGYTDVEARLPVLSLLILISLLSTVLFLVNIRRRGWGLPAVAVGLWALVSIVMGGIYPLAVQRFRVDPFETTREAPYIERNIAATKRAFNLADIEQHTFEYDESSISQVVASHGDNLGAVPLLDPTISQQTFELQQVELDFFRFDPDEIDVDRYEIDGKVTQVLIGARELAPGGGVANTDWETDVLARTHGNGIALAPVSEVQKNLPVFKIGDVPIDNTIADDVPIDQPRIYYGENMGGYAIVDTDRDEVDGVDGGATIPYHYTGEGGVEARGLWRRAMFSLRFQSIDPLISDFVRDDSRFVWNRNVLDRVRKVAPFLEFDHNPYPVVVEGRLAWVVDAYTTTANYPYSQPRNRTGLDDRSDLNGRYNYVRNSVKAVIDAYDGSVDLYVVDGGDPIVQAWGQAFPGVLRDFSEMPAELVDNLRYPEDVFTVQTNMWSIYHIDEDEPLDLLDRSDEWDIAQEPGGVEGADSTTTFNAQGIASETEVRVRPYYSLLRLPDENHQEFVIFRSFVPFSEDDEVKEMKAFMVGVSEPGDDNYGRLVSYEIDNLEGDVEAPAPALVASQITSQDDISSAISLLDFSGEGSSVEFGDLIVVPVDNSLIYVRPLYVIATGTEQPNLERIIASHADRVVMCNNLTDAIRALFGVTVEGVQTSDDHQCVGDVRAARLSESGELEVAVGTGPAAEQALSLLQQADEALAEGDLGLYQRLVERAGQVLSESLAADSDAEEAASTDTEDDGGG